MDASDDSRQLHMDVVYETLIPYDRGDLVERIRSEGELIDTDYTESGVKIKAYVPDTLLTRN